MRLLTVTSSASLVVAGMLWLSALPAAAHPTIDVANPQPSDRVTAGALVMEGLAYDHDARQDAGVDRVSVRICGLGGQFLGDALLGLPSTMSVNKGAAQYAYAGWRLTAILKGAGDVRELCVTARSSVTGTETLVRVPITIGTRPPPPADHPMATAQEAASGADTTGTTTQNGGSGTGSVGAGGGAGDETNLEEGGPEE